MMRDTNPSQGFGATPQQLADWSTEETHWRTNWQSRPYARPEHGFDYYRPGYRYGFEAAHAHRDRHWNDVEGDLRAGWSRYEHRGERTWDHVKDAVRDAWDRVVHRH